jgi:hypothetical protein
MAVLGSPEHHYPVDADGQQDKRTPNNCHSGPKCLESLRQGRQQQDHREKNSDSYVVIGIFASLYAKIEVGSCLLGQLGGLNRI